MNTISYNMFLSEAVKKAREQNIPIAGCFELTPLCNLDCKMCYIHLTDLSVKERMLSGDEWIDLMRQAIGHGMLKALLTGGECLTHPDFKRIYLYLTEQGIPVQIKTNGVLLNKDMIDLFTEYPPYIVDVSLYGCDSESYKTVTGHDVFETVTTNIRAAVAAGLHVQLMITPSAYMLPWIDKILDYAPNLGGGKIQINNLLMEANASTGRKLKDFGLSLEENARIYLRGLEMFPQEPKSQTGEEAEFMGDIPDEEPHILSQGLYCNGGRTTFAVNWDGTMGPCLNFPRDVISADVKTIGFEAAWREVNRGVKNYEVPEECHSCTHNTKCHYCPTQHEYLAAKHLCDRAVCEWRKLQADIAEEYFAKSVPIK